MCVLSCRLPRSRAARAAWLGELLAALNGVIGAPSAGVWPVLLRVGGVDLETLPLLGSDSPEDYDSDLDVDPGGELDSDVPGGDPSDKAAKAAAKAAAAQAAGRPAPPRRFTLVFAEVRLFVSGIVEQ